MLSGCSTGRWRTVVFGGAVRRAYRALDDWFAGTRHAHLVQTVIRHPMLAERWRRLTAHREVNHSILHTRQPSPPIFRIVHFRPIFTRHFRTESLSISVSKSIESPTSSSRASAVAAVGALPKFLAGGIGIPFSIKQRLQFLDVGIPRLCQPSEMPPPIRSVSVLVDMHQCLRTCPRHATSQFPYLIHSYFHLYYRFLICTGGRGGHEPPSPGLASLSNPPSARRVIFASYRSCPLATVSTAYGGSLSLGPLGNARV